MGIAGKLRRLQKAMRGTMVPIEQRDGSTYYIEPMEAYRATFMYWSDSLHADCDGEPRPEPPPVLRAVANAENRREALDRVRAGPNFLPVDETALVEEGRFEPRSLITGKTYAESLGVEDLSEPGPEEG